MVAENSPLGTQLGVEFDHFARVLFEHRKDFKDALGMVVGFYGEWYHSQNGRKNELDPTHPRLLERRGNGRIQTARGVFPA